MSSKKSTYPPEISSVSKTVTDRDQQQVIHLTPGICSSVADTEMSSKKRTYHHYQESLVLTKDCCGQIFAASSLLDTGDIHVRISWTQNNQQLVYFTSVISGGTGSYGQELSLTRGTVSLYTLAGMGSLAQQLDT